jgi:hypothetical protein
VGASSPAWAEAVSGATGATSDACAPKLGTVGQRGFALRREPGLHGRPKALNCLPDTFGGDFAVRELSDRVNARNAIPNLD